MSGGRRSLASVLVLLLACGGGQEGDGPPAGDGQTSSLPDSAAVASADTAAAAPADTRTTVTRDTPAAPQPAAPAPAPPEPAAPAPAQAPAAADTDTVVATPAETTEAAAEPAPDPASDPAPVVSGPLRDEYHQAPRDTVSQEVYDGWKQYNLNCARCHGEDVLGTTIAPHLIVSVRPGGAMASKEAFVQTVCGGRPEKGMPAWCPLGLDMEKIDAIHQYVKGRSEGKISPGRPALRQ
ncbi:MAG: c-type cytochrome [Gemmatimonadales bacterium]